MAGSNSFVANERAGWFFVALAFLIVGVGFGSLISVTVFIQPLEAEFGWLRAETSIAYMAGSIMTGLGGILMGALADRFSTRPVVLGGALMLGGSFLLLSFMDSLLEFYLIFGILMGGLGIGAFLGPLVTSIGFWFERNRGLAISITMAGQSAGAASIPVLARFLITQFGWREAYMFLALIFWAVLIPASLLFRDPPGVKALKTAAKAKSIVSGQPAGVVGSGRLVSVLSLAILGCCTCMTIPMVHVVPLIMGYGFSGLAAAGVLSSLFTGGIAGRLVLGKLMDHLGSLRVLLLASGLQTVTIFWFTQIDILPALHILAFAFGFGFGGVLPCYPVTIRKLVPAHLTARSIGVVFFFGYLAMGLGGFLGGVLYDTTGDYLVTYLMGTTAGVFNLIIITSLHFHIIRRAAHREAPQAA